MRRRPGPWSTLEHTQDKKEKKVMHRALSRGFLSYDCKADRRHYGSPVQPNVG